MLKVYIRNRFRVRNIKTGKVEQLSVIVDKNGTYRMSGGFDTHIDAFNALKIYCPDEKMRAEAYRVESYPTQEKHEMQAPSEQASKLLERICYFNGKGLALNTDIRKRDEQRYTPDKWYTPEIRFAQSVLFNKGTSVHSKVKPKKQSGGGVLQFERIKAQANDGTFTLGSCVVDSIRNQIDKFKTRKDIFVWLRDRGYSVRNTKRIICQVYDSTI